METVNHNVQRRYDNQPSRAPPGPSRARPAPGVPYAARYCARPIRRKSSATFDIGIGISIGVGRGYGVIADRANTGGWAVGAAPPWLWTPRTPTKGRLDYLPVVLLLESKLRTEFGQILRLC